ncbi:MAG: CRTAC1 family protein [Deltaproteobacteria bacterium]
MTRATVPNLEPYIPPEDDAVIGRALKWSIGTIAVLVAVVGGAVAYLGGPKPAPPERKTPLTEVKLRPEPAITLPAIRFTDITRGAHISFVHENGAAGEKLLPESMGGGCAFLDYNNDGYPDVLFVNSDFWPGRQPADRRRPTMALYQNDGHGNFTDVTGEAGMDVSFYGQGVAVGDFDNDGWVDVFFSAVGPDRLFRNNHGKFEDVTAAAGVAGPDREWGTSCAWFDFDNDGDLDLFVCNYVRWSSEIDRDLQCTLDGTLRAYCRPDAFEGTFPCLYRNDGNGRFTDVSGPAGVQVKNPDTGVPVAKSLGVVPIDVDRDGWLDLVVANDTVQNFLFHNRHDGTFEEIGKSKGIAYDVNGIARGAMGIAAGYPRNDNTLAVAIGNFANEPTAFYCAQTSVIDDLLFTDDAVSNGIGPSSRIWLKFGVFFADLDLDGRLDILVANGHLENDIQKVQASQQYAQPPQLFWNAGADSATEFVVIPKEKTGPDFAVPLVGRGAAFADIDGDGDLDVLLTATGGAPRLLRNDQALGHHWLRVKLAGKRCNHDAIGALVEVEAGGTVQKRQVMPACSYLSQVELSVTFGLGDHETIDRVTIHWPDGSTQEVPDARVDQLLVIEQAP